MMNKKNKNNYDWVEDYLKPKHKLKASPYLWTRIKAQIESENIEAGRNYSYFDKLIIGYRWVLHIIFIITISMGAFIGKELAFTFRYHTSIDGPALEKTIENLHIEEIHNFQNTEDPIYLEDIIQK